MKEYSDDHNARDSTLRASDVTSHDNLGTPDTNSNTTSAEEAMERGTQRWDTTHISVFVHRSLTLEKLQ